MHFRLRKKVIQLIRTTYDETTKKGKYTVVGSVKVEQPELPAELRRQLTAEEVAQFNSWVKTQRHTTLIREELAALTLTETLEQTARWFDRQGGSEVARAVAADIVAKWQPLRKLFNKNGLLD